MKIALATTGQFRTGDYDIVKKTRNNNLLSKYNVDIFVSTWEKRGISSYSLSVGKNLNDANETINENHLKDAYGKNVKFVINNYDEFIKNTPYCYLKSNKNYYQNLYQLYKVSTMFNPYDYDYVIWSRHDFYFFKPLPECVFTSNICWHQNLKPAYHPNRVYDIFICSSPEIFDHYSKMILSIDYYLNHDFENGLQKDDPPRLLYIRIKEKYDIQTVPYWFGEVYRASSDDKQLLNHLTS